MRKETMTWQEAVAQWKSRQPVWTAELGGMGPGYEQATQVLLFEIMARWGDKDLPEPDGDKYPTAYKEHVDRVVHELNKWGFSGAQVGQAQATAWQFMKHGYSYMMNKLPEDRKIMVSDCLEPKPL